MKKIFKFYVMSLVMVLFFLTTFAANASTNTTVSMSVVQNEIDSVGQKIAQLTVSSTVTDSFKSELQDIQALATQANNLSQVDAAKAQNFLNTADEKLKKLDQLVDLTNGTQDDLSSDNAQELQGLKQSIDEAQMQINQISINGTNTSALKTGLQDVKNMVSSAQDDINNHDMPGANALIRKAQDRLDGLNDSIDSTLGNDYDGGRKLARDYSNATLDLAENLRSLSEIDPGMTIQIQKVATEQNDSVANVQKIIASISARQGLTKFLFGSNYATINQLKQQINQNKQSIDTLKQVMAQVTDSALSSVLQTQTQTIGLQTAALQVFVQNHESGYSLLGWFFRYF